MKIILRAYEASEFSEWSGLALVTLAPKTRDQLHEYRAALCDLRERLSVDLLRLTFWNNACEFYEVEAEDVLEGARLHAYEMEGWVEVSENFELDGEKLTRTDVDQMLVDVDDVSWRACVHGASHSVETDGLRWEALVCWLHGTDDAAKETCLRCIGEP